MKSSPAFQFYPKDFLSDKNVQAMSDEQLGIYARLICHCWLEGSIPNDIEELAAFSTKHPERFSDNWKRIEKCFEPSKKNPQLLIHPRLEKERKKQKDFSKKATEKAKNAAKARWDKERKGHAPSNAQAMLKNASSSSSTSPSTDINTPLPPKGGESDFYKFFNEYPEHRRGNEDAARRLWQKNGLDARSAQVIESLSSWKKSQEWKKDDKRFVPSLSNFLRDERWKVLPGDVKPPIKEKENPYITAWKSGKRFFHEGTAKTYRAAELVPVNRYAKNETARPLNGFRLPDGLHLPFEDFICEE